MSLARIWQAILRLLPWHTPPAKPDRCERCGSLDSDIDYTSSARKWLCEKCDLDEFEKHHW
jgi:hypothetical protein